MISNLIDSLDNKILVIYYIYLVKLKEFDSLFKIHF